MTLYSLVVFFHVAAVLALFACLSLEALSLSRLRRASSLTEARLWLEPVPSLPLITLSSALVIILSGVYLTMRMSAFGLAWVKVAMAALLLIAPFGALTGRRMRAIRHSCSSAKVIDSKLTGQLQEPVLKTSLGVRMGVFLGIVMLMAAKPELRESITIIGTAVLLGLLSSVTFWRGRGRRSAGQTLQN